MKYRNEKNYDNNIYEEYIIESLYKNCLIIYPFLYQIFKLIFNRDVRILNVKM